MKEYFLRKKNEILFYTSNVYFIFQIIHSHHRHTQINKKRHPKADSKSSMKKYMFVIIPIYKKITLGFLDLILMFLDQGSSN